MSVDQDNNSTETSTQCILMENLSEIPSTKLYSKLQEQFKQKPRIGYSLNFTSLHDKEDCFKENLFDPVDTKISHRFQCILILESDRIQVFDLISNEFKQSIPFPNHKINHLSIEKTNKQKEYLHVTSRDPAILFKFDLEQLLQSSSDSIENLCLWKSQCFQYPSSLEILYRDYHENQILLCDLPGSCVHVLDSLTGTQVEQVKSSLPYGAAFLNSNSFVLAESVDNLTIYERLNENSEFYKTREISFADNSRPNGGLVGYDFGSIIYDPIENNIIVSNHRRARILVFSKKDLSLSKVYETGRVYSYGMCLDEYTGELYISSRGAKMIIYK